MAGENVIIGYTADISDIKKQVTLLQRLNTSVAKKMGKDFTKNATIVRNELTKIATTAKQIKLPLGGTTNQLRTFTTVLKGTNGQLATVKETLGVTKKGMVSLNTTVSKGATVTRTMGQNLATLAKRAALTIPLWFALRQGVGSVFRTIREGLKAIVDFDRALQKARRNLQGTAEEMERNFGILKTEITKLSIETGKSVEDITNAFQKFATVGFDFETSLAGANFATKTAILLFGDATQTANAFARTMRVLADESDNAKPISEQLGIVMAETVELWKTNAFELNEFTSALERFAPVAKTAGFTAGESAKIIATLGTAALRGSRGGRLLATSITRLVTKTDELAKSLGIKVNPEVDRTFDVFIKTLDVLTKTREETDKVAPGFEKIVKSIFGLRSSQAIKGLIALNKELKKNLAITGDINKLENEFEEVNEQIFQLVAQFHNLNREIGKAFVTGLVGGEDFIDTLGEIQELQTTIVKNAQQLAKVLKISTKVTFGGTGEVTKELEGGIESFFELIINKLRQTEDFSSETFTRISKGIRGALKKIELEKLIIDIQEGNVEIPENSIIQVGAALRKRLAKFNIPIEPEIKLTLDNTELTIEEENKIIQNLIDDQLKRLKLDGATESQILKIKDALKRQFDVNDGIVAQKQRQLDIERAITQEQKERIKFSSESVKLAEIAKTEGTQTAIAIGEVLSGQRDLNTFLRQGGERAEILKSVFEDFVKNKQLEQFFKGERVFGEPGLRGGERIPIRELGGAAKDITARKVIAQLELAAARLGLKESTDKNNSALVQNNSALVQNTASIDTLINLYKTGIQLTGTEAQRFVAEKVRQSNQKIDINLNISGTNLSISGTVAEIRAGAQRMAPEIIPIIERAIAHTLETNNNAPISKATDGRINKF